MELHSAPYQRKLCLKLFGWRDEEQRLVGVGVFLCAATHERRLGRISNMIKARILTEKSNKSEGEGIAEWMEKRTGRSRRKCTL